MSSPQGATDVIRGSVNWGGPAALPADAVLEVRLSDISRQDVAAPVIAEITVVPHGGRAPLPFELRYDPSSIEPKRSYAVRATIRSGGQLLFTTYSTAHVITGGSPSSVDLELVRVAGETFGEADTVALREAAIGKEVRRYRVVSGAHSAGDYSSRWTAYFDRSGLRYLEEKSDQADYGSAQCAYTFEQGVLRTYISRETRTILDPARPAGKEQCALQLGFDGKGRLSEKGKSVDGRPVPVESTEVHVARARAKFLSEEAARVGGAFDGNVEARGNEPFWMIRVEGSSARLRTPDEPNGEQWMDGQWTRSEGGPWVYEARHKDAERSPSLRLELTKGQCVDSMSGAERPLRATLIRDGRRMEGCATTVLKPHAPTGK